ncbi:MAG: MerR family transcriptional regulator [Patescibacteria group bacterium]
MKSIAKPSKSRKYTVKQLAILAGLTVRTLHFYDECGLLEPELIEKNGYRVYGERELLRLQQILFFRELDFPLGEIKKILNSPGFDMVSALRDHRKLIELKRKRLTKLLKTIDITIKKMNDKKEIKEEELYGNFSDAEQKEYAEEAKQRWGNTEAYKQSMERTKHWTKENYAQVKKDGDELMKNIVAAMSHGIESDEVQKLIGKWRAGINVFYDTTPEICRGLASMYISDSRFTAYYEKYQTGLAQFMHDAIFYYCDHTEK